MSNVLPFLELGPTRLCGLTTKISGERTGLRASVFLHVDYDPSTGKIWGVRLSEKGKDGSTLDSLLHAIGDEATSAIRAIQEGG